MPWTIDLSGQQIFYRLFAAIVVVTVHGLAAVLLARLLGDRGPQYDGRLSLNPFRHLDPVGMLSAVLTQFGWSRPPRLTTADLRGGVFGVVIVILGSLAVLLALAKVLWMLRATVFAALPAASIGVVGVGLLERTAEMAVHVAVLNLIPLPPLGAGLLIGAFAPHLYRWIEKRMMYFAIGIGLLTLSGMVGMILARPTRQFAAFIFNL